MGGRAWSQEELIRLEELTETYPLATVARKLNRSENAVFLKRQRTGIGGFMANTDMLTRNTLSRILGVENRTLQYWERKGLKSVRKNPYVMYRQQDIIRYMEEHPEAGIHNQRDRREDEPVGIKYQIQTLRKGEKQWQKLRSGREAKTKPEASC